MPLVSRQAISFIKVIRYAFVFAHAGHIMLLASLRRMFMPSQAKGTKP